jgi:hypothetical protein
MVWAWGKGRELIMAKQQGEAWREWFDQETRRAGEMAWTRYMQGNYSPLYLVGKPGELRVVREDEKYPGYELVSTTSIPLNLNMDGMVLWVRVKAKSFPCLPAERS